jgi:hypothetical protein
MRTVGTLLLLLGWAGAAAATGTASNHAHRLAGGRVVFDVARGWEALGARGDEAVAFQIAMPAADGTADSANASVMVRQNPSESFEEAVGRVPTRGMTMLTRLPMRPSTQDALLLSRGQQGGTPYIVIDRLLRRGALEVRIRVAWPLLPGSTQAWEAEIMNAANRLVSETRVDGKAIGAVGRVVANVQQHDGKPLRLVALEEG